MASRMKKAKALAVFCGLLALAGTALLAGCGGMNTPPAAGAVGPETVFAGYVAEFDGTTSSDLDEDELTYAWGLEARPADSAATMSTTDVPLSSLVPDVVGHYVISLVVKDEESHSPASYRSFEAKPWFRDATKEAGVGGLGISGQYFRLKSDPLAGAAWGDYDGDGDQDLWVAIALYGSTADQLYRNNGDGTFTDVAEEAGVAFAGEQYDPAYLDAIGGADQRDAARGVLWGDYDGDGDLDLYRVNSGSLSTDFAVPNNLYRNNGDGTFFDVAPDARVFDARFGMGGAWGDYDGDGDLDLAVANFARFNEDGTFSEADALYRNNGDGTFSDVAPPAGLGQPPPTPKDEWTTGMPRCAESWQPFWFDYDGDGALDYFVSCEVGSNLLYRNNGDGTFADVTEEAGLWGSTGHGIDAGDYDGDGDLDLFVTGTGTNRLWRNEGNGTFTDVTSAAGVGGPGGVGWGTAFFDFDNDGDLDMYVGAGDWTTYGYAEQREDYGTNRLYENNGDGTFTEVTGKSGLGLMSITRGVALADYDDDGDVDLFITCSDDSNYLFENQVGSSLDNRWLKIRLEGTESNTFGIGATVTVKAGDMSRMEQLHAGGSFLSMDAPELHFGLGPSTRVDEIEVRWPSGAIQIVRDVEPNQTITITEGS